MPYLVLYIDETDAKQLLDPLNRDPEIAFIVSNGPGSWIAKKTIESLSAGRYCLWHFPSGPLPLVLGRQVPDDLITDPWAGWREVVSGADMTQPYFGPGHPGTIWLTVRTKSSDKREIGLSAFEWIGNWYRIIGTAAHPTTEAWWKRLRKSMKSLNATRIPRSGPLDGPDAKAWAFPSALAKIRTGMPRDLNP